jgi:hypothetical protein
MYSKTNLSIVIMNLMTHAKRLFIHNSKNKMEHSVNTVKMALQAEIKMLKSNCNTPNLNKAHLKCTNTQCEKTGHIIDDCFQPGGEKTGQYPPWWKEK